MNKAEEVEQFLAWLEHNNDSIGYGNVFAKWSEFSKLSAKVKAKFKLEGGKSHTESEARSRRDITDELMAGNYEGIGLHAFGYPLKKIKILNFDKKTKTLTLQVVEESWRKPETAR